MREGEFNKAKHCTKIDSVEKVSLWFITPFWLNDMGVRKCKKHTTLAVKDAIEEDNCDHINSSSVWKAEMRRRRKKKSVRYTFLLLLFRIRCRNVLRANYPPANNLPLFPRGNGRLRRRAWPTLSIEVGRTRPTAGCSLKEFLSSNYISFVFGYPLIKKQYWPVLIALRRSLQM